MDFDSVDLANFPHANGALAVFNNTLFAIAGQRYHEYGGNHNRRVEYLKHKGSKKRKWKEHTDYHGKSGMSPIPDFDSDGTLVGHSAIGINETLYVFGK